MPEAAYPTDADVVSAMPDGVTPPAHAAKILLGVIGDFERRTGYVPFLGATGVTTRTYDPPFDRRAEGTGYLLDLEGGFWDVDTIELNDSALTITTDFILLPLNAAALSRGWDKVQLLAHPGFEPSSIDVTGKQGYAEELPDDIWTAILEETVGRCLRALSSSGGAVTSEKQGGVTIAYDSKQDYSSRAAAQFKNTIFRYMRI